MLLFKPEHKPMILSGQKTVTRRFWKTRRAVPGSLHQARLKLFGKPFATLRILEVSQEHVGNITDEDVRAEGYESRQEYFKVLREINNARFPTLMSKAEFIALKVWVVRFKVEEVCDDR